MLSEWQSVGVEIMCAVLSASFFVAQCVVQERAATLRRTKAAK